jgi:hypothetical protein
MREWLRTALFTSVGIGIVACLAAGIFFLTVRFALSDQRPDYGYPGGFPGPVTTGRMPPSSSTPAPPPTSKGGS